MSKILKRASTMSNALPIQLKLVLVAIGLVLFYLGLGLLAIFLVVSGIVVLFWCVTRRPKPKGELPSSLVSCCHYLGEQKDEEAGL